MLAAAFALHYYSLKLAIWLRQVREYIAWVSSDKPDDTGSSLR